MIAISRVVRAELPATMRRRSDLKQIFNPHVYWFSSNCRCFFRISRPVLHHYLAMYAEKGPRTPFRLSQGCANSLVDHVIWLAQTWFWYNVLTKIDQGEEISVWFISGGWRAASLHQSLVLATQITQSTNSLSALSPSTIKFMSNNAVCTYGTVLVYLKTNVTRWHLGTCNTISGRGSF